MAQRPAIVDFLCPMTPVGVDTSGLSDRIKTPSVMNQLTPEQLLERMDSFGIGQAIIPARRYGPQFHLSYELVRDFVATNPTRLFATAGVDPLDGPDGVHLLEEAIRDWGFKGAYTYSSWSDTPANDKIYYPYYSVCEKYGVPFQIECMNAKSMVSHGHPRYIEEVAVDFPELKIVATHTGYPWERDLVATAEFRHNVYIGCDTLPPKLWSHDLLAFILGETYAGVVASRNESEARRNPSYLGTSDRCIFGSNYLSIHLESALPAIEAFNLPQDIWAKLMAENARRLYNLPAFSFSK